MYINRFRWRITEVINIEQYINFSIKGKYNQRTYHITEPYPQTIRIDFSLQIAFSMTTQYEGYSSYNQDISHTQQYDTDQEVFQDVQKSNRHNQTYEEALNFPLNEPFQEITDKIKISDALSKNLIYQCPPKYSEHIKKYQPETSRTYGKNIQKKPTIPVQTSRANNTSKPINCLSKHQNPSRLIHQQKPLDEKQNIAQETHNKKSKSRSLLYFQQKQTISQTLNQLNYAKRPFQQKIDFPLQQKKCPKLQQQSLIQTYYLPISQQQNTIPKQKPRYFAKNQSNSTNTKRQILLTSRSGYNLSISGVLLENIAKQYENHNPNKQNQSSLKQKIQLKLIKDKKKRIKTQIPQKSDLSIHKRQVSKLYRPLDPSEHLNQRIILSTDPFQNRQQKTLQNKKKKVQLLKEKKLQAQIKQCTFRPKTNISKNNKSIK